MKKYKYPSVLTIAGFDGSDGAGFQADIKTIPALGCFVVAFIAAFVRVVEDKIEAAVATMTLPGIAGELAGKESQGPGSLQLKIIDKLYNIKEDEFYNRIKISKQ